MAGPIEVDLLVIGAGPAGLYAAFYAGFRGLATAVMDSLPEPGGQVSSLYPEKIIYDIAGLPSVRGQELIDNLLEQTRRYPPQWLLSQRAETLVDERGEVVVGTHKGLKVRAKAIIVTGGIGTFAPRPLAEAEEFEGRGLRYFVPRLEDLRDHDVVVVGGGDSAVDWAKALEPIATSVTLVHRRGTFRAHEATVKEVLASSVRVLTPYQVAHVHGGEHINAVDVFNVQTDECERLTAQAVVAALGFTADLGPITRWGVRTDKRQIVVDTTMRTNLPRVFAAGDITTYPGKVKLIAVGFGEAATAVNNAATVVDPTLRLFPGHSSDSG